MDIDIGILECICRGKSRCTYIFCSIPFHGVDVWIFGCFHEGRTMKK